MVFSCVAIVLCFEISYLCLNLYTVEANRILEVELKGLVKFKMFKAKFCFLRNTPPGSSINCREKQPCRSCSVRGALLKKLIKKTVTLLSGSIFILANLSRCAGGGGSLWTGSKHFSLRGYMVERWVMPR